MSWFIRGACYGAMALGWLVTVGAGVIAFICIGAVLTAISDKLSEKGGKRDDEPKGPRPV